MRFSHISTWLAACTSLFSPSSAIEVNTDDPSSIQTAASIAASNMLTFYNGTKYGYAPGILTNPYYWWEAGAMFSLLIHFWHLTGNDSYNQLVMDGLLWQKGDGNNFEPTNQTKDLGNDDQSFWAYAALDAAEFGLPNPPAGNPSWLALAQAVFNRQIGRWDAATCNGGLRWQIYSFNPGWNYKNTAANGGLFHISARLARYTGNSTYADQAERLWTWMTGVNFVQLRNNNSYAVIDGADTTENCTTNIDNLQWTYNHGTVLMGAAYMYNYTNGSSIWKDRLAKLVNGSDSFFVQQNNNVSVGSYPKSGGLILAEVACEELTPQTCKVDQPAFKSTLIRWLAVTTQLAPQHADHIFPLINGSAIAAGQQCIGSFGTTATTNPTSGGALGNWCGRRWFQDIFDGYSGLGEQMSAMSAFQNVLIKDSRSPYTTVTGGNSTSDPDAGNQPTNPTIFAFVYTESLGPGDTAGAWILTALAMIIIGAGAIWMVREGDWASAGEDAGWMAPSAGAATYYRKTYGYGAYRLAGLQAGGVYRGKSAGRLAFAKPNMPAMGLGAGGWWFGTGRGTGEKWWEKDRRRHEEEMAGRVGPYGHAQRGPRPSGVESAVSDNSRRGFFSWMKGDGEKAGSASSASGPKGKDGEWKRIGKGVFVRAREVGADGASGSGGSGSNNAARAAPVDGSRRTSRAQSVAKGSSIHWPA